MSWSLAAPKTPHAEPQTYQLSEDKTAHIVHDDHGALRVVHELNPDKHTELGRIVVGRCGAKLEAVRVALDIISGHVPSKAPQQEKYQLLPRSGERVEIILLRPGDLVSSSVATSGLTCLWHPVSEIQVTSSAAEAGAKEHANVVDGVADTPEEETEDEDLEDTVLAVKATQSKSQQPRATPQLSHQRSVVIQETPTAARVNGVNEYPNDTEMNINQPELTKQTPESDQVDHVEVEPYSTARTGQSQKGWNVIREVTEPQDNFLDVPGNEVSDLEETPAQVTVGRTKRAPKVVVKKRPNPARNDEDPDAEPPERPLKRTKRAAPSDNDNQDSRLSNIEVETSPAPAAATAKKGRPRKSAVKELEDVIETTPSRSQRSSQRSVSVQTAEPYSGDTPRVATSNSSITDKSHAVKFLKKQGATLVESTKEGFNILCVRDGDLYKTSKVLQAVATGTPIVTDKWLTDSAKANQFLSVDAYRPSVPKQEKEWKFKLDDIFGQPQTPFEGYTIHFTTSAHALYKPFTEIEQVCNAAGAVKVTKKKMDKSGKVIVLAMEGEDKEAEKLMQDGITCYYRHLLPMSIFRGTLDLDSDEFKISAGGTDEAADTTKESRSRRGRKG
ncbi:hypothetical protein HBH61_091280 [Parastagonospora nodorum]|nr:hypothetical protein HBH61_091280 [Parastagonospora nodorum]